MVIAKAMWTIWGAIGKIMGTPTRVPNSMHCIRHAQHQHRTEYLCIENGPTASEGGV